MPQSVMEALEPRKLMTVFTVANLNDSGDGSLRDAILSANLAAGADVIEFAPGLAGTIALASGELTVTDSVMINGPGAEAISVTANRASRVFKFTSGTSSLSGLSITEGYLDDTSGASNSGAGVYNAGSLVITNSKISNSRAIEGGGLSNDGVLTIVNSTIAQNDAERGGGVRSLGTLTITGSAIWRNNAYYYSGGGVYSAGTATITNSTLSENLATGNDLGIGAGVFNAGDMLIANSTLAVNTAGFHGGGVSNDGALTIVNSTIVENWAGKAAGGIENHGILTAKSTIVAGNTGGDVFGVLAAGSTHNLVQDPANSGGLTNGINGNILGVDPLLDGFASNGGPTQTKALRAGSPAIGKGVNPNNLASDQRGGPFVRGTVVDIGAYQMQSLVLVVDSNSADAEDANYGPGNLTLREAVNIANANPGADSVSFATALRGSIITLGGEEITVDADLAINGPGAGLITVSGNNASRVFNFASGVSSLSGLTIANGFVDDSTSDGHTGGGILNRGTLTVTNATLLRNVATEGGGISNQGVLTINGAMISQNSASSGGGGGVGSRGTLTIINSTISHNRSSISGGGVYTFGAAAISGSTISDNLVSGTSYSNGGGVYCGGGQMSLMASTLSGNIASQGGGGIFVGPHATVAITNSTISGNTARLGAGVFSYGDVTLSNSTVARNTASDNTGGIYCSDAGTRSWLTLQRTLVAENTGGDLGLVGWSSIKSSSNNLIGDFKSAGGLLNGVDANIIGIDPKLAPLADNGGPTLTHALRSGSPAINKGGNRTSLTTDQRGVGFARAIGQAIDIGAFEFGNAMPAITAEQFIDRYAQATKAADGLVDGDWIAETLQSRLSGVAKSDAYWGGRNFWFQDSKGDVWSLWQGGDVHKSKTLAGQHEWTLTNLTDAGGLTGTMHFAPGSLSGITTGWNAFNIQGIQDGKLTALWWSPAGSAGTYVDTDGQTKQGGAWGLRGNGWSLSSISDAATAIAGAITRPPAAFLAYSESQGNGRTEFDPRSTRTIINTGMSVVVVDTNHHVFVITFSVSQRTIAGARADLNGTWTLESLREVPSLVDMGLAGQVDQIEQGYVVAATM